MALTEERKKEIEDKVRPLFGDRYGDRDYTGDIEVTETTCYTNGDRRPCIKIKLSQMYEAPEPRLGTLKLLNAVAEAAGMRDVNTEEICDPGCETCDYGSEYGHEFFCFNPRESEVRREILEGLAEGERALAAGETLGWDQAVRVWKSPSPSMNSLMNLGSLAGWTFFTIDYSNIEMRCAANISRAQMQEAVQTSRKKV